MYTENETHRLFISKNSSVEVVCVARPVENNVQVVQTIKRSCTDFMFTDYVSCSSVYISFNVNIFI